MRVLELPSWYLPQGGHFVRHQALALREQGVEVHAGFQLYKQLLTSLVSEGVQSFDLEKMGASAHSTNAVFLFKQGIRGQLLPLCGEWSWYKRRWYSLGMYFVKKYLWKKQQA